MIETDSAPFELPFEGHISQAEKGKSESLKQTVNSGSAVKTVEEKDFLELKYIKQKITTELENAKLKLSTQELQISELKNISQTVTRETEYQTKIVQLEDVIEKQLKEIELNSQVIENLKREVTICKDEIKFYTKQPVHVHKLMKLEEQNFFKTHPLRWGILYSFIMNTDRNSNLYTLEERDFWIDRFNHSSKSEFDNLSSNLNGPRRGTVQKWMGPRQNIDFRLSARRLLNVANFYHDKQDTVQTISDTGGLDISVLDVARVESLHWASENPNGVQDIEQFDLFTCMIDETANRINVQYKPEDGKTYGWSAMPRFVLLRNVTPDFDFKAFFPNFKFQYDKKRSVKTTTFAG